MATIKFYIRDRKNTDARAIFIRLIHGRKIDYSRDTGLKVSASGWNIEKQRPKTTTAQGKNLNVELTRLKAFALDALNSSTAKGEAITGEWLERQINKAQNRAETKEEQQKTILINYIDYYIDYLRTSHIQRGGKRGVSNTTVKKFITLKARLVDWLGAKSEGVYITDIDLNFLRKFDKHLTEQMYSASTVGKLVKNLKAVCKMAESEGYNISDTVYSMPISHGKAMFETLSFEELEQIQQAPMPCERLENAKDWLLIGCTIGQRVGDLLSLTRKNVGNYSGVKVVELEQEKTGARVFAPLGDNVINILAKRGGDFPRRISAVKFNQYIKEVCKLAGLDAPTKGAKVQINPKTKQKRKVIGIYPKYELIASHVCRRSFATNLYGEMATPLIMSITGHTKESTLLSYIGKTSGDYVAESSKEIARVTLEAERKRKKDGFLNIVHNQRKAN